MLTGKKLYDGDTLISRLMKHRDAPLPSLVKTRDDAPWPLEQVLHKMIAKRPQDRYQSMDEVVAALEPYRLNSVGGPTAATGGGSTGSAEFASFMTKVGGRSLSGGSAKASPEAKPGAARIRRRRRCD